MCHPSEEDRGSQNGRLTMLVNMSVGLCSHRVICDETNFLVKPLSFNMAVSQDVFHQILLDISPHEVACSTFGFSVIHGIMDPEL